MPSPRIAQASDLTTALEVMTSSYKCIMKPVAGCTLLRIISQKKSCSTFSWQDLPGLIIPRENLLQQARASDTKLFFPPLRTLRTSRQASSPELGMQVSGAYKWASERLDQPPRNHVATIRRHKITNHRQRTEKSHSDEQ